MDRLKHGVDRLDFEDTQNNMPDTDKQHGDTQNNIHDTDKHDDDTQNEQDNEIHDQQNNSDNTVTHIDDSQNKFYEVKKFMCKKYSYPQDKWFYRVKWRSFSSKHNSWVAFEDLNPAC